MINLRDILPIFKKRRLTLISKKQEVGDMYSFVFKLEGQPDWKAGQHGVIFVDHVKIEKPSRPFSLASAPNEDVMISMRISDSPSAFKKTLRKMEPGQQVSMRGPIGSFYIKDKKPVLFIAGGIGITPYRALIKDNIDKPDGAPSHIKLLYADDRGHFAYDSELRSFARLGIDVELLTSRDELKSQILAYIASQGNESRYYVSGPARMVKAMKALLREQGIKPGNIVSDAFFGY